MDTKTKARFVLTIAMVVIAIGNAGRSDRKDPERFNQDQTIQSV